MNEQFMTTFPRSVLDRIVTQYFRNLGVIAPSVEIEINNLVFSPDEDDFQIEADLKEVTMQ